MEHLGRITALVTRVKRRVRLQTALRRLLVFGAIGLLVFGVSVLLVKTRLAPTSLTWVAGAVAIALAAGGVLSGLVRRFDDVKLAATLDASSGLHSRLGSALAFAKKPNPTELEQAAIADAATVVDQASPKLAAPWQWSAFVGAAAFAAVSLLVSAPTVLVLEIPVSSADATALNKLIIPGPPGVDKKETVVSELDKETLEDAAETLEEARKDIADTEVAKFLDDLNELLRALKDGELTPEEVHRKLAALDKAKEEWTDTHAKDLAEVGEDLQKAAEKQRRAHKEMDPLLDAMRDKQWKEAAEALERTAKKTEEEALKKRDKDRIGKDLEKLAKSLESDDQKEEERLKKDKDRLKKKEQAEQDRFSKKNKDRLKQTERRLEELRRAGQAQSEARRELEKLQRNLSQAAKEMLRRQQKNQRGKGGAGQEQGESGQAGGQKGGKGQEGAQGSSTSSAEQLRQAAETLRRLGEQGQGQRQLRVAEGRMTDVREMMRRAGQQKGKQGKSGQQAGKDGQKGKHGQKGQEGGKGEPGEMGRFLARAGGEQGEGQAGQAGQPGGKGSKPGGDGKGGAGDKGMALLKPGGKGGKPGGMVLLGGPGGPAGMGGAPVPLPGSGQGEGGAGGQPTPGEGAGAGHDGNLFGKGTDAKSKFTEHFVAGQKGAGESESVIIQTAASKGFVGARYRKVHQDYTDVVEDSLDRQKIPAGKRRYVRRYFDLIRPR